MKKKPCFVLVLLSSLAICHGASVQFGDFVTISSLPYLTGLSYLYMTINETGAGTALETQQLLDGSAMIINHTEWVTLGNGLWLLEMQAGDVADYTSIFVDENIFFQSWASGHPFSDEPLAIPKTNSAEDNTVFLAFAFGFEGNEWLDAWLRYGWIELGYDGTAVYIVNCAVETTGLGIIVGVIPEPSPALLALSGLALLPRRRRIPRHCEER